MEPKYKYFEVVKVLESVASNEKKLSHLKNVTGVISGTSQGDDGRWVYAIFLEATNTCWCFEEYELESTGEFVPENYHMSGESIRGIVNLDGNGRGRI